MGDLVVWAEDGVRCGAAFFELVLGCGVHASHDRPPAERSPLTRLRGDIHTGLRIRIAEYLGANALPMLYRLRGALVVWGSLEAGWRATDGELPVYHLDFEGLVRVRPDKPNISLYDDTNLMYGGLLALLRVTE